MLRKRSTTNSIIGIEQFGSLNVSPHNSCRVFRSLIGKTKRNHLHIIISGYPLTCRKEFRGLGTIAMISPTQYGCSFDGISNRFPNYRKKIIEVFNNLPLELRKNITHEGVKKNIEIDRTFFSSKGCEKTRLSIIIENHFSQISESIKIMDSTHGEKMVSSSLRKALKLIFVFVKSQYKHDIEIITDKSSVNSNKFNIDHNDDGDGYINWITTVTSTIIPFTIFIGGLIIVTTFVINKKSDKKIKEDQNNAFKGGIIIDDFISKNNDSDSDY
uniref:DDE_Tnp_1_7 domain-containing protein n=1 Tax=Parastrongyloides trichosuri TaxID=131310 RepID=A0A0N4ZKU6_PARTI